MGRDRKRRSRSKREDDRRERRRRDKSSSRTRSRSRSHSRHRSQSHSRKDDARTPQESLAPDSAPEQGAGRRSKWDEGGINNLDLEIAAANAMGKFSSMPVAASGSNVPDWLTDMVRPIPGRPPVQYKMIRLLSVQIRVLLGVKGQTIRDITARTGADVKVNHQKRDDPYGDVTIIGNVQETEDIIRDLLQQKGCPLPPDPAKEGCLAAPADDEADLLLPTELVGLFIGKAGDNIKEMRERAGGSVFIGVQPVQDAMPGFQRVQIVGDDRDKAKELVRAKIELVKRLAAKTAAGKGQSFLMSDLLGPLKDDVKAGGGTSIGKQGDGADPHGGGQGSGKGKGKDNGKAWGSDGCSSNSADAWGRTAVGWDTATDESWRRDAAAGNALGSVASASSTSRNASNIPVGLLKAMEKEKEAAASISSSSSSIPLGMLALVNNRSSATDGLADTTALQQDSQVPQSQQHVLTPAGQPLTQAQRVMRMWEQQLRDAEDEERLQQAEQAQKAEEVRQELQSQAAQQQAQLAKQLEQAQQAAQQATQSWEQSQAQQAQFSPHAQMVQQAQLAEQFTQQAQFNQHMQHQVAMSSTMPSLHDQQMTSFMASTMPAMMEPQMPSLIEAAHIPQLPSLLEQPQQLPDGFSPELLVAAFEAQQAQLLQQWQFIAQTRQVAPTINQDLNAPSRFKDGFRPLKMCRQVLSSGFCSRGQICTFGHAFEELHPTVQDSQAHEASSSDTSALAEQGGAAAHEEKAEQGPMKLRTKRDLCQRFQNGDCMLGKACHLAHKESEIGEVALVYVTPVRANMCKFFKDGRCFYGRHCQNAHNEEELGTVKPAKAPPIKKLQDYSDGVINTSGMLDPTGRPQASLPLTGRSAPPLLMMVPG